MKRAILIDGNSIIYRCFYSMNPGRKEKEIDMEKLRKDFCSLFQHQLKKWLNFQKYSFVAIVCDSSRKSFRTELDPEYKQNRDPMPEELIALLPETTRIAKECGFNSVLAPEGYEADDLIGTMAKQLARSDYRVDIFTTDKDLLQLVDYLISVYRIKKSFSLEINSHMNFTKLNDNLLPFQIPLFKALTGDSSDNYKGVPSIGTKTALKLIWEHKTEERLLVAIDSIPEGRIKSMLVKHLDELKKCLELSKIKTDINFKYSFSDFEFKGETDSSSG